MVEHALDKIEKALESGVIGEYCTNLLTFIERKRRSNGQLDRELPPLEPTQKKVLREVLCHTPLLKQQISHLETDQGQPTHCQRSC